MSNLSAAIAELESGQTHKDMLAELKARTITVDGMASGADVSGVLLSVGLLSLIRDQVNLTDTHTKLRNICIALSDRFLPDGQIDLANPGNVAVIDEFLADATVGGILTAQSIVVADLKDSVMLLGQSLQPEFPGTSIRDVIGVRVPSAVLSSESNVETGKGKNRFHDLELTVSGSVPVDTHANIMVRHSQLGTWRRVDSIPAITTADTYYRRLPGEFVKDATEIKCQCAYNISMTLTATAV